VRLEELVEALDADDAAVILLVGSRASDRQRAAAWGAVAERLKGRRWRNDMDRLGPEARERRQTAQSLFSLVAGPPDVVQAVGGFAVTVPDADAVQAALATRSAAWRREFGAASLRHWAAEKDAAMLGPWWWDVWLRVRQWERAAVIPLDTASLGYLVMLIRGLTFSGSIEDGLLADPELCNRQIWSLFEPGDGVQRALLSADRYWDPANTWRPALVRLAVRGKVDAARLRDAAERARQDDRLTGRHRAWYARIPQLLDNPATIPLPAAGGPPPPGHRLRR
jgi:hypothetical protein